MPKYEVQTHTLCQGWINCWMVHETDESTYPETFPTRKAAGKALDEFMNDIQAEIDAGQRKPDEVYDREDFRIVKVAG